MPTIVKYLLISLAILIATYVGYIAGTSQKEEMLHQANAFHAENYAAVLEYINRGETELARSSLELKLAVAVLFLPRADDVFTDLSQQMVNRAFLDAKCYGIKYSWKNLSPDVKEKIERAVNENVSSSTQCP